MIVLDTAACLTTTWLVSTVLNNSAVRLLRASVVCSTCRRIPNPKSPLPSETLAGDLARRPALSLLFSRLILSAEDAFKRREGTAKDGTDFRSIAIFSSSLSLPPPLSICRVRVDSQTHKNRSNCDSRKPRFKLAAECEERERERNGSPCLGLLSRSLENRCPTSSNF